MDPIKIQQILAIVGVVMVGAFYLIAPYKSCRQKKVTLDGYLLANQTIVGYQFANTFAVTGIALAGKHGSVFQIV